jgi:hypothetical protein
MTYPTSCQRGRPMWLDSNFHLKSNILAGARHQDWQTYWPSVATWLWLWLHSSDSLVLVFIHHTLPCKCKHQHDSSSPVTVPADSQPCQCTHHRQLILPAHALLHHRRVWLDPAAGEGHRAATRKTQLCNWPFSGPANFQCHHQNWRPFLGPATVNHRHWAELAATDGVTASTLQASFPL